MKKILIAVPLSILAAVVGWMLGGMVIGNALALIARSRMESRTILYPIGRRYWLNCYRFCEETPITIRAFR
jgi:hypothetical protein